MCPMWVSYRGFLFPVSSIFALVFRWIVSASLSKKITRAKTGEPCTSTQKAQTSNNISMEEEFKKVADLITANTLFCTKEVLTSDEVAAYMGISKSHLYKLTMMKEIPHYKPTGKLCYFNRKEVEQWLQSNRVATCTEIDQRAQDYCMRKGGAR